MKIKRIDGLTFDRLKIGSQNFIQKRKGDTAAYWNAECECGNKLVVRGHDVRVGRIRSCGCLKDDKSRNRHFIHGHAKSPTKTYASWAGMKARCSNPGRNNYKNYGAKGIKVCERWMKFNNFLEDMGERPKGTSLDRIDPTSDYSPSNCRWATRDLQMKNIRPHKCLANWSTSELVTELRRRNVYVKIDIAEAYQ